MQKSSISRKDFLKLMGGAFGLGALAYIFGLRNAPKMTTESALPEYLDDGSAFPVFRGPTLQQNVELAATLYPAEIPALTLLCNQTLNRVADAPFEYLPLMPNLLLVYADMLVSSLDERDAQVGMIPEREVGFWMLTIAMQKTALGNVPHHLAWFIPHLLVDESNAIATGRELYGFNKQAARIDPTGDIHSPQLAVDVLGLRQFSPLSIAQNERLLTFEPQAGPTSAASWEDWSTAEAELASVIRPRVRKDLGSEIVSLAAQTALQNIPLVFLKQFRHAAQPQKACYQAIVEAPLKIQAFHGGGFLSQPQRLSLYPLESHPLARRLGLQTEQASALGAWLKVDFELGLGKEYR